MKKLDYTELKKFIDYKSLGFETTKDILPFTELIGQKKAKDTFEFGLQVKSKGYNIYVSGVSGTGKMTFAKKYAREIASNEKIPPDICYVYNFDEPKCPKIIKLEGGKGKEFKADVAELMSVLTISIPEALSGGEYEREKNEINKQFQEKRNSMLDKLNQKAKEQGFGLKMAPTGVYFLPIVEGEMIDEEQYEMLSDSEKTEISENSASIRSEASETMLKIKDFDKEMRKEINDLQYQTTLFTVGYYIHKLQVKYEHNESIHQYLNKLKEDILENSSDFLTEHEPEEDDLQGILSMMGKGAKENNFVKYEVNLCVDNSKLTGAPVIVDYNPTYNNLMGELEFDSEMGNLVTDFTKIKAGLFHKANGGYLILNAQDVLMLPYAWEAIRRVIKTGKVSVEPLKENLIGLSVSTIKPEALDVDVKVILVGSYEYYDLLRFYDDEFYKLFKTNVQFDYEMNYDDENLKKIVGFVKKYVDEEGKVDFSAEAVAVLAEYSLRLSEKQEKFSSQFNKLKEILVEATTWSKIKKSEIVTGEIVKHTIEDKVQRVNLYEEKLNEMIIDDFIMIDTSGSKVGQINGLAVLDTGDHVFGKPSRITATTYAGKSGIVNIEKEVELSGSIHDKGVQVIIGYLGNKYAQEFPLSFSARICFEQNYNGVDGDSASSTELYALLSSLSDAPINQEFAVTGSVNQWGEIQPIGGVTYKIEGFFDICRKRGLTGSRGVIIPIQNVKDLVLNDEVIEAVKAGQFSIYAISHIDEGIELLTGVKAGQRDENGLYPENSINGRIYKKLQAFNKKTEETK